LEEKDNLVNSRTKEESLRLVLAHERTQTLRPLRLQKSLKIHRLHEVPDSPYLFINLIKNISLDTLKSIHQYLIIICEQRNSQN